MKRKHNGGADRKRGQGVMMYLSLSGKYSSHKRKPAIVFMLGASSMLLQIIFFYRLAGSEFRSCVKVAVAVLGFPS